MLELFIGQLSINEIKHDMTYKEMLSLRKVRIERLEKERKELEKERKEEQERAARENARNRIMKK
jgi:hypothetical protein